MFEFTKADLLGISLCEYCNRQDITIHDLIYKKQNDLHMMNDHYQRIANQEKLTPRDIAIVQALDKERNKVKAKLKEYYKEVE